MSITRRGFLATTTTSCLVAAGGIRLAEGAQQADEAERPTRRAKRALAILGDAWHCVAPLYTTIVNPLKKRGYRSATIIDYAVPFEDFDSYDLIAMSRYAYDDVTHYRDRDGRAARKGRSFWLTEAQEQRFEDYVKAGGKLFLHHDGIGFYRKGGPINRLAKAHFIKHPPIVDITIRPTGKLPELTRDVDTFTVPDEEYQMEMDESETSVFLESHSPEHGRTPQGWAHSYGKGKVAVLIPGHDKQVLTHPMTQRLVWNVIDWLEE